MSRLLATLCLVSSFAALASEPAKSPTLARSEVRGDAIAVRVGEETGLPAKGITRVPRGDVGVIQVLTGSPYLRVKGLKPGNTKLVLHKASGNTVTHAIFVK